MRSRPPELWSQVNQTLIAKSIGELCYEQILEPRGPSASSSLQGYELPLSSGCTYHFKAWRTLWDHLRVAPASVTRTPAPPSELTAAQFFIDAQKELGMTDLVLGNFLEEMHSTLYADMHLAENPPSAREMSEWDGARVQAALNGHPKLLLNKGRMGWGASDLERYAPENEPHFKLVWLALHRDHVTSGLADGASFEELALSGLAPQDLERFGRQLTERGLKTGDYLFAPAHPWQWDRILKLQYAGEIAMNRIVALGACGDSYQPQISLRTLSNVSRPAALDLKLPLSILNTSAIRGIPARYIHQAPMVAAAIAKLCESDPVLKTAGAMVLSEQGGLSYRHPEFSQVRGAPYRYHETLGVIWRESAESKLGVGEKAVMSAALMHQDREGRSLIGAYIQKSGLKTPDWLTRYFESVVVPLYHLQLKYGLGLVAHGQNVVLKMTNHIPSGVLLKDFQGDLRLSSEAPESPLMNTAIKSLDRLPPEYLIHDLLTGHLLTVLRFVSGTLQESEGFPETEFYRLLREVITRYLHAHAPQGVDPRVNLLNQKIHRVLLNKVRFKIGYADSAERPLPLVGSDLLNPLVQGETHGLKNL